MRLFRSNLRRLARRPATLVTYLLLIGLVLLIILAVAAASGQAADPQSALAARLILTFPAAWTVTLSMVLGIGGMLALTYGAAIAGSEWSWGTLKAAVARGEGRSWYTLMGIAGVTVMAWVGTLIAYAVGIVGAFAGAAAVHVASATVIDAQTAGDLAGQLARAGLGIAMDVAIGYAIATIARSQLAGIGAGIGLYFGEGILGIFVPQVIKWAPFAATSAMLGGGSTGLGGSAAAASSSRLDPDLAVAVVAVWLVLAVAVAALWTERAEISG
jgi:ABC-2 type transport system permease protein